MKPKNSLRFPHWTAICAALATVAALAAQAGAQDAGPQQGNAPAGSSFAGRETTAPPLAQRPEAAARSMGASAVLPLGYRIGPGDMLQIHVWKDTEASVPAALVRSDGKISLPMIKEVDVLDLTPSQLERVLTERYARFINDPEVTVLIKEIHSQKIFLVGAVQKQGSIRLQSSMTVLQALAEAGGLTQYAKKSKIYVLRPEDRRQVRLPFDYDAVIRGDRVEQNIIVLPGDTIVIP